MAKITRKLMKIFGLNGPTSEFDQFGSVANGGAVTTKDVESIQSLSNWLDGWAASVIAGNSPVLEDMNAKDYVFAYQLAYLMQQGTAEYNAATSYYIGSLVNENGVLYKSLADDNLNNPVSDGNYWKQLGSGYSLNPQAGSVLADRAVTTWISKSTADPGPWIDVCWSQELNLFVAVAESISGNCVMTSPDGDTWTGHNITGVTTRPLEAVCWAAQYGLFIAVASDVVGSGPQVITSPDGINWVGRTAAQANIWLDVCFSPSLGRLVAVSQDGADQVMYSNDGGINWSNVGAGLPTAGWSRVVWSEKLQRFVAFAFSGAIRIAYSSDGLTWSGAVAPLVNTWNGVIWCDDIDLFIAVSQEGNIITSGDGISWTQRTSPAAYAWVGLAFSAELGEVVAFASSGAQRVMVSRDGINWSLKNSADDANTWREGVFSPQLGYFVAVAATGTNLVMNSTYVKKFIAP